MKDRVIILAVCAVVALSGCSGFIPGLGGNSSGEGTAENQTEYINIVNGANESHTVTVVVEHNGVEIANETHVLRVPNSGEAALERVTYKASGGESYRVSARMNGGEWYSGEINEEDLGRVNIEVEITESGEFYIERIVR